MKKILRELKPFIWVILGILGLVFVQSLSELGLPMLMAKIVDVGIVKNDTGYILSTGGIMVVIAFLGGCCAILVSLFSSKVAARVGQNLRKDVFDHINTFSLNEFDKFGTSSLITRVTNDVQQVQQIILIILRMVIHAPLMCIGGIFMAVTTNAQLSMVFLITLPVLLIVIAIIAGISMKLFTSMQKKLDHLNLVLREKLIGVRVIRAFNKDGYERKRFDAANKDLTDVGIKVNRLMAVLLPVVMLIMNVTTVLIVWFSVSPISQGLTNVGDMMAFIQYGFLILMALMMMSMVFIMLPKAMASAKRIEEVLDTEATIINNNSGKVAKNGNIEFKNVSFAYGEAERPCINDVSFSAKMGETTAIIGGTGSGKSTLLNLIMRFYDIDHGEITMGGQNIKDVDLEVLRQDIGFVPQKAILFSGTIRENICFGKEDATDDEVNRALDIAQATDFVEGLDGGVDYFISQGGTNVSGGQKQRLSIARAIAKKPKVYLFDDSFSALDFKTDANLRKALKEPTKDCAVIIVAQRVSTIIDADNIIVMHKGAIVGMGKHKDLMESCEEYAGIVSSQLTKEELA